LESITVMKNDADQESSEAFQALSWPRQAAREMHCVYRVVVWLVVEWGS
jgi:hypothetical protein